MQGSSRYFLITVDVGLSYSRIMQGSSRCFLISVDVGLSYSRIMQGRSRCFFNYCGSRAILQQNNARQL